MHIRCRVLAWVYLAMNWRVRPPSLDARYAWWENLVIGLPDHMCASCEERYLDI